MSNSERLILLGLAAACVLAIGIAAAHASDSGRLAKIESMLRENSERLKYNARLLTENADRLDENTRRISENADRLKTNKLLLEKIK